MKTASKALYARLDRLASVLQLPVKLEQPFGLFRRGTTLLIVST